MRSSLEADGTRSPRTNCLGEATVMLRDSLAGETQLHPTALRAVYPRAGRREWRIVRPLLRCGEFAMTESAIVYTDALETARAADELATKVSAALSGQSPHALITFASPRYDAPELLTALTHALK